MKIKYQNKKIELTQVLPDFGKETNKISFLEINNKPIR